METETQLIQALSNGNEKAFRSLYKQYYNYLMVVGSRYLTDKLRVEDVINDVFLDLWKKRNTIQITVGLKAFLRGATTNKCLAILRKDSKMDYVEQHSISLSDGSHSVDHYMEAAQIQKVINQVLDELPPKRKKVYSLSREKGWSHKEIAAEMGISTKTIENHMTLVLKSLRNALKKQGLLRLFIYLTLYLSFN